MGLRRSRYIGEPGTYLQHAVMATAMNACRLYDWLDDISPHTTPLTLCSLDERSCLMKKSISPPIQIWVRAIRIDIEHTLSVQ